MNPRVRAAASSASYVPLSHSTPTECRPQRAAAHSVVPVPANGSSTVSFSTENIRMSRSASSLGNAALRPRGVA